MRRSLVDASAALPKDLAASRNLFISAAAGCAVFCKERTADFKPSTCSRPLTRALIVNSVAGLAIFIHRS